MIVNFLKESRTRYRVVSEKNNETVLQLLRDEIMNVNHRRPDVIDELEAVTLRFPLTKAHCFDVVCQLGIIYCVLYEKTYGDI